MKRFRAGFIAMLLLLGACSNKNGEEPLYTLEPQEQGVVTDAELPEDPAVQHTYTRSFLVSPEQVEEGFYEMRTWTDAYTMWIPAEASLDETYYSKRDRQWEQFLYGWENEADNISYGLIGQFEDRDDSEVASLRYLTRFMQFGGDYTTSEDEENIYYYGKQITEVGNSSDEKVAVYSYIGFIKHKNSGKSLGLVYEQNCSDWSNNCELDTEQTVEHFWKILKSVDFDE